MPVISSCKNLSINIRQFSQCQETTYPSWFQSIYYDRGWENFYWNVTTNNFNLLISAIKCMEDFVFKIHVSSREINYTPETKK